METIIKDKILKIKDIKDKIDIINAQIDKLNLDIENLKLKLWPLENELDDTKLELLHIMQETGIKDYSLADTKIRAGIFKKVTKNFDEKNVISILKAHGLTNLINVKESVFKKDLTKELKTNEELREELLPYTSDKETDYVVVADEYNYLLMLEHMKK